MSTAPASDRPARWYDAFPELDEPPFYPDAAYPDLDARYDSAIAALRDANAAAYEHLAAVIHDEEMARYDGEETNPVVIDHQRLEEWYSSQEDVPY